MSANLMYRVQMIAIDASASGIKLEDELISFTPLDRQHLLPQGEQTYDSLVSPPELGSETLDTRVKSLCDDITDEARAVRVQGRAFLGCLANELEQIYEEIEGNTYAAPEPILRDELAEYHGILDLAQDLEELSKIVRMYPELSEREQREELVERCSEVVERLHEVLSS